MTTSYSVQEESSRILHDVLLSDSRLNLPASVAEAAQKVKFTGGSPKPFIPMPLKTTESCAALTALVGALASVAAAERYGIPLQNCEVNTDIATLFLEGILLPTIDGKPWYSHEHIQKELKKMDLHNMSKPIKRHATTIYKTKDGRWYHSHGSMNPDPMMKMLGIQEVDVSDEEAIKIYAEKIAQWDSHEIERVANDEFRQAGVVCYTPDEFFASEQGKIMAAEPLWSTTSRHGPRKAWPEGTDHAADLKPLAGIRIIDFSRVIAAPAISKLLSVLGADVLRISYDGNPDYAGTMFDLQTGKRDANLNLKSVEGRDAFVKLIQGADVLINGFRPGVLKRLGFDSHKLREINPSLIYMQENCYGFKGPLSYRSGWQQISDCLVGLSWLQGKFQGGDAAIVPLLPNSDYQTGLIGAAAAIQALIARAKNDVTFDIDVSLTQYNIWFYRLGLYTDEQQAELRAIAQAVNPLHTDDMAVLVRKAHAAITKLRPDIMEHPEYFWKMSTKEWGVPGDVDALVLAPAFKFEKSKLEYVVPCGRRGRSKPEWIVAA